MVAPAFLDSSSISSEADYAWLLFVAHGQKSARGQRGDEIYRPYVRAPLPKPKELKENAN